MKVIIYWIMLVFSILTIFGGILTVSKQGLTIMDTVMFVIFISLILFSVIKLKKHGKTTYRNYDTRIKKNTEDNKNYYMVDSKKDFSCKNDINTSKVKENRFKSESIQTQPSIEYPHHLDKDFTYNKGGNNYIPQAMTEESNHELNAYDILILHMNNKREVGKEITNHHFLIENQINVKRHLDKLIEEDYLIITSKLEISLPYLKVPELKDILRKHKLKLGGNKPELIDRIINNIDENSIEVPKVYLSTSKGDRLIEESKYILHFYNKHIISLGSAHKIAKNAINVNDKTEFIYLKLLEKHNNNNEPSNVKINIINNLINYYKNIEKDMNVIRKYSNYSLYLSVTEGINSLGFHYNDSENILEKLKTYYFIHLDYYENLLLISDINRSLFKKIFYEDIITFEETDKNYCKDICEVLFAYIYGNEEIDINNFPIIKYKLNEKANEWREISNKYKF
ncbi:SAP domain-containing protein [Staphylococcus agnetis]|uniref:SAP domain-containing protein n=1 Tax=Staphylococcus agnetis TaxID=985762 RepID=UPI0021D2DF99|nr:SAP domain-containing protein [Staphylococcus agnetis]UXU64165.1 SAP domain-containing protein [Staphylococcus agnetis]UXU66506.1 SAP domain-containing protein [Staphylococcus agnetis]